MTSTVTLRPYQTESVAAIRESYRSGRRAPLFVLPTGGGKTVTFAYIAHGAMQKGNRVLILAHRGELLDQISEALTRSGVPHGFIAAGYPEYRNESVAVASVQTLVRRVMKVRPFDLIVVDEAHHATIRNSYGTIFKAWPESRQLGVTATPCRLGGEALGDVFDTLLVGPPPLELVRQGFLSPVKTFAPPTIDSSSLRKVRGEYEAAGVAEKLSKPSVTGDAISHYKLHAGGLTGTVFCHSIEHSKFMAQSFRSAGFTAAHLDGNTPREIRRQMISDIRTQRLRLICAMDIVGEGVDIPGLHVGIMLRPTTSESLYLQQGGRIRRPFEGKDFAILLDHVGNAIQHGLLDEEREWTLEGRAASHMKKRDADDISVRVCPKCFAAGRSGPPRCGVCGHVFEVKQRSVDEVAGELQELTPEQMARKRARREQGKAQTLEDLLVIEKERKYKAGWAQHVFDAKRKAAEKRMASRVPPPEQQGVF